MYITSEMPICTFKSSILKFEALSPFLMLFLDTVSRIVNFLARALCFLSSFTNNLQQQQGYKETIVLHQQTMNRRSPSPLRWTGVEKSRPSYDDGRDGRDRRSISPSRYSFREGRDDSESRDAASRSETPD